jgi:hypothetical protein
MERLRNSFSTVTLVWNSVTLKNPEDGDDALSETSVSTRATRQKIPEGINKSHGIWFLFILQEQVDYKLKRETVDLLRTLSDLRFSRRRLWRIPSSGMLGRVALIWTDVSEELNASIIRFTRTLYMPSQIMIQKPFSRTSSKEELMKEVEYILYWCLSWLRTSAGKLPPSRHIHTSHLLITSYTVK